MTDRSDDGSRRLSREELLKRAAVVGGVGLVASLGASARQARR